MYICIYGIGQEIHSGLQDGKEHLNKFFGQTYT